LRRPTQTSEAHMKGRGLANGLKPVTWLAAAAAAKGSPTTKSFCLPIVMAYTEFATSAGVWLMGSARTVCLRVVRMREGSNTGISQEYCAGPEHTVQKLCSARLLVFTYSICCSTTLMQNWCFTQQSWQGAT